MFCKWIWKISTISCQSVTIQGSRLSTHADLPKAPCRFRFHCMLLKGSVAAYNPANKRKESTCPKGRCFLSSITAFTANPMPAPIMITYPLICDAPAGLPGLCRKIIYITPVCAAVYNRIKLVVISLVCPQS